MLVPLPSSFAACIYDEETGMYLEPCKGLPLPYYDSPRQQLKDGILIEEIKCNNGRELIFKSSNNMPACVYPETVMNLIERGWAKSP